MLDMIGVFLLKLIPFFSVGQHSRVISFHLVAEL